MRKVVTALYVVAALLPSLASAQFGMVQLPRDDFIWRWGDATKEAANLSSEDFLVRGGEQAFQCELTGALSAGSHMTTQELQEMERELTASLYFIQTSAYTMNELERQLDLRWAVLDCKRPQAKEESPDEIEAKVERARQKAVEEMLRRRERAQRQE